MEKVQKLTLARLDVIRCGQLIARNPPQLRELKISWLGRYQIQVLISGRFTNLTSLELYEIDTQGRSLEEFGAVSPWPLRRLSLRGTGAATSPVLLYGILERFPELTELTLKYVDLKTTLRKGYKPPDNLLSKLKVLNLEEISNLPNLEIHRLFRPERLPSVENLSIITAEKTTVEELINASQWLKNLRRLSLWQLPPWRHSPTTPTDAATYKRLFSSLKGAKLKELIIDGGLYSESVFKCVDLQHLTSLEIAYDPKADNFFVAHLCAATLPELSSLSLTSKSTESDSPVWGLDKLIVAFPRLRSLSMSKFWCMPSYILYEIGKRILPYVEKLAKSCNVDKKSLELLFVNLRAYESVPICPCLRSLTIDCCGWEALEILAPRAHHMPNIRRLIFSGDIKKFSNNTIPIEEAYKLKRRLKGTFPRLEELKVGPVAAPVLKDLWPLANVS